MVEIEVYDEKFINMVRLFAGQSQEHDTYSIRAVRRNMGGIGDGEGTPGISFHFVPASQRKEDDAQGSFMRWFTLDSIEKFSAALLVLAAQIREKEA